MKLLLLVSCAALAFAQPPDPGRAVFESRCAVCHGGDGKSGEFGPSILAGVKRRSDPELVSFIRTGSKGMPSFSLSTTELAPLLTHLRRLANGGASAAKPTTFALTSGDTLEATLIDQGADDVQVRDARGRIRLLRRDGTQFREVTSQGDWPSYDGSPNGNRFSELKQIHTGNVARLVPKWIFPVPDTQPLQVTPVVVEGVMYVTTGNQCYALDAGTGREIWHYRHSKTLMSSGATGINRGVAVAGERLFMVTSHAHLVAVNRFTGKQIWDIEMGDAKLNYGASSAPLVVGDLVVSGIGGGDGGARGFLAAYGQKSGDLRWRFWTAPKPGEPGSETWRGPTIEHPGTATWFTGSYDPQLGIVYWQTGNPGSDHNGDERRGDNLYSCSVVALDAKTGKLKWYYQFTPHDVWDWDAAEPLLLVDAEWQGAPRKLLLQANRNGFFYVLDRVNGKLLLAEPFVKPITWASRIGENGRPVLNPKQEPSVEGTRVCPSLLGAANWWSNAYSASTGLFYVEAFENCAIYTKRAEKWEAGHQFMAGSTRQPTKDVPRKFLRAIDVKTGKIAWDLPQTGAGTSRVGALATAGGLVFSGDDSNAFLAADAATGKLLWRFQTNEAGHASPMTYTFDNRQYVALASGANIIAFALLDP